MISYLEFMERLMNLNKNVNTYFLSIIRAKNLPLTSMELLLLFKLATEPNITPQEVAKKSGTMLNHLKFLLNSLEQKQYISISSKDLNFNKANILLEKQGLSIFKEIEKIKIPKDILENLNQLEIYSLKFKN